MEYMGYNNHFQSQNYPEIPRKLLGIPSSFACIWLLGDPRPAWLHPSSTAQGAVLKPGVVMAYGGWKMVEKWWVYQAKWWFRWTNGGFTRQNGDLGGKMVVYQAKWRFIRWKLDKFRAYHGMWGYKTHSSQQIGRPTMRTTTIGTLRRRVMIMICLFCDVTIKVHLSIHIVISPFEFEIFHGIFTLWESKRPTILWAKWDTHRD